jgi:hypothetical protein
MDRYHALLAVVPESHYCKLFIDIWINIVLASNMTLKATQLLQHVRTRQLIEFECSLLSKNTASLDCSFKA